MTPLEPEELTRYSRQLMLPGFGPAAQAALKAASVVIVGMGGLGCPVATYLAAAGVGQLTLIDHDTVDMTNLHRQVLYTPADAGRPKVQAAAQRLSLFDPNLKLITEERRLAKGDAWFDEVLSEADVVVDGTDNFPTRYAVNAAAVARRIPLSYGSVYRYTGEVSTFLVDDGPCYACLHAVAPPPGTTPNCAEGGVLGVLPGMVGMLQATEVLKLLAGLGRPLSGRLLSVDVRRAPSFREWRFQRRPDCHVCGNGTLAESPSEVGPGVPEVSLLEYRQRLAQRGYLLVDIRSPEELAFGALRGSAPHHGEQLEAFLQQGPRPAVFACKSGGRSGALVARLQAQGWNQALSLAGSWKEWGQAEGESLIPY
jgi:molybdopterin/thiamine biosynthesis adenylyltransferase/rhodanese-related sulfurtransferase